MATIPFGSDTGETFYFLVWDMSNGKVRDIAAGEWDSYLEDDWADYDTAMTEQGSSGVYLGTFPTLAEGQYWVAIYRQVGASPAVTDELFGYGYVDWSGTAHETLATLKAYGVSNFGATASDVATAILATPANKLATNASGYVAVSNVADIATAVWGYVGGAGRTLSSFGTLVADVAYAVWNYGTRVLTAFGFTVTETNSAAIKAVTDKLNTALVLDGAVYQFTANALELAPDAGGDATAANQVTIIDAIAALSAIDASAVATAVWAAELETGVAASVLLQFARAYGAGKVVRTSSASADPAVYDFYNVAGDTVLFTLTIPKNGSGRTVA